MIDTVILESPHIDNDVVQKVMQACIKKYAIFCDSGQLQYEFTSGSLTNSYDNRISLQIRDNKWYKGTGELTPCKVETDTYLRVECSVHKQMIGHNVYGGSSDFHMCCKWLVKKIEILLGCTLPDYGEWIVNKIDTTQAYDLGNENVVKSWFRHMNNCEYSRRAGQIQRYGDTGLYIPGSSTTLKFYHKGTEFWKHDRKKLKSILKYYELNELQEIANKLLRVEVSIKVRKLKYDFGQIPKVKDITPAYLENMYDNEVDKILKGFKGDVKMVRKSEDVCRILYSKHTAALAGALYGTWMKLSAHGEKFVKETMKDSTFYYHKKKIIDAGCHWNGADIVVIDEEYPADFVPVRTDKHIYDVVHPEILVEIEKIKAA